MNFAKDRNPNWGNGEEERSRGVRKVWKREEGIRLGEELFMEGKRWERMNSGDSGAGFGMKLVMRGGGEFEEDERGCEKGLGEGVISANARWRIQRGEEAVGGIEEVDLGWPICIPMGREVGFGWCTVTGGRREQRHRKG